MGNSRGREGERYPGEGSGQKRRADLPDVVGRPKPKAEKFRRNAPPPRSLCSCFPRSWLDLWVLNEQTWELTLLFMISLTMYLKTPPAFLGFCLTATSYPPLLLSLLPAACMKDNAFFSSPSQNSPFNATEEKNTSHS